MRYHQKIGLEKSPVTSKKAMFLDRVYSYYPEAYYLHLTRHPVSTRSSWKEFAENKANRRKEGGRSERIGPAHRLALHAYEHPAIYSHSAAGADASCEG